MWDLVSDNRDQMMNSEIEHHSTCKFRERKEFAHEETGLLLLLKLLIPKYRNQSMNQGITWGLDRRIKMLRDTQAQAGHKMGLWNQDQDHHQPILTFV